MSLLASIVKGIIDALISAGRTLKPTRVKRKKKAPAGLADGAAADIDGVLARRRARRDNRASEKRRLS